MIGKIVTELREQWHCPQDNLPCYTAPGIHLKLTAKLLAMWAECIVSKNITYQKRVMKGKKLKIIIF